jgi:hypothetical protein
MIHFFNSVKTLKDFLKDFPDDMPIAIKRDTLDDVSQIEVVYITRYGKVVGDEANDYSPKDGELKALVIQ